MESMFGWVNTLNEISGKKSFTNLACRDLVDVAVSIVCIVNADINILNKVLNFSAPQIRNNKNIFIIINILLIFIEWSLFFLDFLL